MARRSSEIGVIQRARFEGFVPKPTHEVAVTLVLTLAVVPAREAGLCLACAGKSYSLVIKRTARKRTKKARTEAMVAR